MKRATFLEIAGARYRHSVMPSTPASIFSVRLPWWRMIDLDSGGPLAQTIIQSFVEQMLGPP